MPTDRRLLQVAPAHGQGKVRVEEDRQAPQRAVLANAMSLRRSPRHRRWQRRQIPPGASLEATTCGDRSATGQKTIGTLVVAARAAWVEGRRSSRCVDALLDRGADHAVASSPARAFRTSMRIRSASGTQRLEPSDTPATSAP